MNQPLDSDLNQVIANAVNARIEATVAAALSGDELIGQYVAAALNQEIRLERNYRTTTTTYLKHTIDEAMREATKAAVQKLIAEEREAIEEAVRKELRRGIKAVAEKLVGSVVEAASSSYRLSVNLEYPKS
jgi:hypothetical protein